MKSGWIRLLPFLLVLIFSGNNQAGSGKTEYSKWKRIARDVTAGNVSSIKEKSSRTLQSIIDQNGKNLLMLAVSAARPESVECLLRQGISSDAMDHESRHAGFYAVKIPESIPQKKKILELLLKSGMDWEKRDLRGRDMLDYAIRSQSLVAMEVLAKKSSRTVRRRLRENAHRIVFDLARDGKHSFLLVLLQKKYISPEIRDEESRNLYFYFTSFSTAGKDSPRQEGAGNLAGQLRLYRVLRNAHVPMDAPDKNGDTPLMFAIKNRASLDVVRGLDVTPCHRNKDGHTAKSLAQVYALPEIFAFIRKKSVRCPAVDTGVTNTIYNDYLRFYIAGRKQKELRAFLARHKEKRDLFPDNRTFTLAFGGGNTPIYKIISNVTPEKERKIHREEMEIFLKNRSIKISDKMAILVASRKADLYSDYTGEDLVFMSPPDVNFIQKLGEIYPPCRKKDSIGRNAMMVHVYSGDPRIMDYLLKKGCNVTDMDHSHRTLLMYAVLKPSNETMMKWIIHHLPDADKAKKESIGHLMAKDVYGKTAMEYAKENHNYENLEFLKSVSRN